MINIQIDDPFTRDLDPDWIREAARETLLHQSIPEDSELSIVVTGDTQIQDLNRQFLDIDAPTDVLSFPSDEIDPESGTPYLGDVLISYPRALDQAGSADHPVKSEMQLLVVHGVLHLLGYDHAQEEGKNQMWTIQAEVLTRLDSPIRGPGE